MTGSVAPGATAPERVHWMLPLTTHDHPVPEAVSSANGRLRLTVIGPLEAVVPALRTTAVQLVGPPATMAAPASATETARSGPTVTAVSTQLLLLLGSTSPVLTTWALNVTVACGSWARAVPVTVMAGRVAPGATASVRKHSGPPDEMHDHPVPEAVSFPKGVLRLTVIVPEVAAVPTFRTTAVHEVVPPATKAAPPSATDTARSDPTSPAWITGVARLAESLFGTLSLSFWTVA